VEADTLQSLGWVFWYQGIDYPAVNTTYYEQALDLYREIGNRRGEADVLYNLGVLCVGAGDLPAARSHYEQARGIYREIGYRSGEAAYLDAVTWVCWGEDDYAGAKASAERALAIYREVGSRPAQAEAQVKIGETRAAQGYYADGEACFGQALRIFRETGRRGPEGATLSNLGLIRFCQGDYAGARMFLERAGSLCRDYAAQWAESKRLAMLGLVLHAMGEDEAACDHAQQALENGPQRYHLGQGDSALVLGHALAGLGDRAGATAAYYQALDRYRQSGFLNPPMEAVAGLARLELAQGEPAQALIRVNEILGHLKAHTLDGTYEPFRIYWTCYRVLKAHDDGRAAEVLRTACRLLQERATRIEDDGLRRSFLEGVPAHRKLVREHHRLRSGGADPREQLDRWPQAQVQRPPQG
jgi:tetratricopeptide (TPR) repeat protein